MVYMFYVGIPHESETVLQSIKLQNILGQHTNEPNNKNGHEWKQRKELEGISSEDHTQRSRIMHIGVLNRPI